MSVVSVEDVFLRIASGEAHEAEEEAKARKAHNAAHAGSPGKAVEIEMAPIAGRSPSLSAAPAPTEILSESPLTTLPGGKTGISPRNGLDAVRLLARTEMGATEAFTKHARAVFLKRACYARRDLRSVCCLMLVPLITLLLGLALLASARRGDQANLQLSTAWFNAGGARARNGPPQASTGKPAFPNYVPAFTFKTGTPPVWSSDVAGIYGMVPTGPDGQNISSDGGNLLLLPAQVDAIPDTYKFIAGSTPPLTPLTQPAYDYARMSTFLLSDIPSYAASKVRAWVGE